ncbi:CHASE2 domain-containing protein [Undibacterium sp. Rencai35W]|uniref:CHASE2 domain-containing protein n=1 Tax=Undibacterium sp. Rencai35W TaxID=3413046 RepID=UPI003BEF85CE
MMRSLRSRLMSISAATVWWLIGICAVCITVAAEWATLPVSVYPGDEWLRDRYIVAHTSDAPETRITMVDIDETSLAAIGPWPWPRARIADLIEHLVGTYGVRGVALDLFFSEPADAEGDMRLAMLAQHGPVVMAQVFDYDHAPLRIGKLMGGEAAIPLSLAARASGYIGNHAGLSSAKSVGNIGFVPDADGVLRHLPPQTLFEGRVYPTLSRALFDCCAIARGSSALSQAGMSGAKVNKSGFVRVPYRHSLSAFTIIKASDILHLTAPAEFLKGKLVILGSSSLNLSDRVSTPLSPSTSGFLVHTSALSDLLDTQEGIAPQAWQGRWLALLFSIAVAMVAMYTFPRLSALSNIAILAGASVIWVMCAYVIHPHDDFFAPTGPLLSNLFLLTIAVPYGWQVSQGKSQRLLGTLQQYVAKAVVDELLRSDLKDPLAPRQLHVTTLIADMEAYTSHVASLPVQDAARLTRDFLECLTGPVLAMGGTLDKYTGDGLVAFWGAPLPVDNHADLALDAGIQIMMNLRSFNMQRKRAGLSPIRARIGVESGIAMAGDFGTSFRSIYTAVGDSVNVASRLEDVARDFPYDIIIGQGTVTCATRHQFKFLGERILKGREHPSKLFTLELNQ